VLDIACGTGALAVPLAQQGFDVTACDISQAMVAVTRRKLEAAGLQARTFAADMTEFDAGRQFSLAIIARSGFMHLTTPERQRGALLTIKKHLVPGGALTLNTFQPHPSAQAEQMGAGPEDYTLRAEYVNAENKRERIYNAIGYDMDTQIMRGSWKFETLGEDGNVTDTRVRPIAMRQTYTQELKYLCELCGYEILECGRRGEVGGHVIWLLRNPA
ncbi:MAG: class I SAM-dependent methyltransferase, partial [Oscillospiraceae bacterium]|jgi:SAM-dependent methyltransferase|nr:class I SAM-dependent methyltransferase [Oscillospiraceae bacterium]